MAGKIVYDKLLDRMKEKGLTTYKIRKEKIVSESTMQNIRNNGRITTDAIASLCEALECQPGDILRYVPDTAEQETKKIPGDFLKNCPTYKAALEENKKTRKVTVQVREIPQEPRTITIQEREIPQESRYVTVRQIEAPERDGK